ncbi:hypothetical protein LXA54_17000 [Erwinia amylovora]|uniref:hypothetical protein n=1 Tax=Erwinia amylovora TaxID=552 RepID=UPI0020C124EF|nr:hypothetical protein [Erwinia amylovora]MCK8335988.1 hypothetical protein [Erwinia amylovora]
MRVLLALLVIAAFTFFAAVGLWAFDAFSFREAVSLSVLYTGLGLVVFEVVFVLLSAVVLVGVWFACSPVGRLYAAGVALLLLCLLVSKLSESIPDSEKLFGMAVSSLVNLSMLGPVLMFMGYAVWYAIYGRYKEYGY